MPYGFSESWLMRRSIVIGDGDGDGGKENRKAFNSHKVQQFSS